MPHLPPAHHETSKCDSPNKIKIKEKQNETILDLNSNLAKSMTHRNQTKELATWFLNLPLDESIDNKSTKFEARIQDPKEKARKAEEGHLEEGKPQKPTKGTKSGKAKQNGKERAMKSSEEQENLKINTEAQKSKKSSKLAQKLKINTPLEINSPNTLNACSPPRKAHLSCFFSHLPD
jgi:hypothetical protein